MKQFKLLAIVAPLVLSQNLYPMLNSENQPSACANQQAACDSLSNFFNSCAYKWFVEQCSGEEGEKFMQHIIFNSGSGWGETSWYNMQPELRHFFSIFMKKDSAKLSASNIIPQMCSDLQKMPNLPIPFYVGNIPTLVESINLFYEWYHTPSLRNKLDPNVADVKSYFIGTHSEQLIELLCLVANKLYNPDMPK